MDGHPQNSFAMLSGQREPGRRIREIYDVILVGNNKADGDDGGRGDSWIMFGVFAVATTICCFSYVDSTLFSIIYRIK